MSTTTINFTMKDLDGTVVPLTDFVISSGRLNTGEIPDVLPADLEFTTDDDGQATVELEVTEAPYYITKQDGTTDTFISYKFFVPFSATPLDAELLYVDLGKLSTGWNDKSVAALIEAKVVAVTARNQALQLARVLGTIEDIQSTFDKVNAVGENIVNVNTVGDSIANVNAVAPSIASVVTVAPHVANIDIVAENIDEVAAVGAAVEQAVDGVKDLFIAGTHYTKDGTSNIGLSNTPAKPNTVKVFFDGIYQNKDTYYTVGNILYFGVVGTPALIPADTVEVQYEVASQFVGLTAEDQAVLTAAQNNALASAQDAEDAADLATVNGAAQVVLAEAAQVAAEAARDSSFANAKGAATIADARALVADTETFIVYTAGAATFAAYRRTSSTSEVFLGEYPSASAAMLTSGDVFASLTPRAQVFNGATLTTVSGRSVGFVIPVGQTGGNSFAIADIPAVALRGKTVRLVQRYQASASWSADVVPLGSVFAQYRAGASFTTLAASNTSRTQVGTEIVQTGTVVVPADADFVGLLIQVSASNVAETVEQTIQIVGVAYQVVSDANATQTIADTVLDQRLEWINPAIAAAVAPVTSSVTDLSARVDQNALTSGNVLGTATVDQDNAEAFNGATITSSGGLQVGFVIASGAGTGDLTYITRFIDATALVGLTVDFVAKYTTTADFSTNCPARANAMQVRINGTLTTVSTSTGATRTITQVGTELTVTTRYTVPAGTTDLGMMYQVNNTSTTQAVDRSIAIDTISYSLVPAAGSTKNDVMLDDRIDTALAEILDGTAHNTTVIQAGATRTYTTPKAANDAVTQATTISRTEIQLDAGTYSTDPEGWTLARYVALKGYGQTKPVIHYVGADGDTHANNETFWVKKDAVIDGVRVTIRNGRYAIHAESGTIAAGAVQDCTVQIKNSEVEHFGNANNNWATQSAWGSGISSGWHVRSENNVYRAPYSAFFYHTNLGFSKPTLVENIGDTFVNTGTASNGIALDLQPMGSGQKDQHRLIGCTISGMFRYTVYAWQPSTLDYQPANHCEIESSGYGNTPAVFRVVDFGRALRIRAVAGAGSSIAVSGSAVAVIFGTVRTFAGVENLPAYVDGSFDVSGTGVGPSSNVYITSLGKRLGNCTSANKTLTVTVNGGAPVDVVFNADYTNVDNTTIIAAIQAAIGSTSTVVVDTYAPGERYHPRLTDEENTLYNQSSTVGIPKGSVLAYDGARRFVRLMTSSDASSLFAGVALEDIYPLSYGRVKTRGWLWIPYVNMSPVSLTFNSTMSVGATPGRVDAGGTQGLLRAVRTDAVEVAP